jgi:hypothetical protein
LSVVFGDAFFCRIVSEKGPEKYLTFDIYDKFDFIVSHWVNIFQLGKKKRRVILGSLCLCCCQYSFR